MVFEKKLKGIGRGIRGIAIGRLLGIIIIIIIYIYIYTVVLHSNLIFLRLVVASVGSFTRVGISSGCRRHVTSY